MIQNNNLCSSIIKENFKTTQAFLHGTSQGVTWYLRYICQHIIDFYFIVAVLCQIIPFP